ncbi:MAG TPA: DUF4340 domain-containing protein [Candidatus Binataceae bacterium]|nr:DUF4340 domain-containing protein [Candidatus Binataceae bacterium]
MRIRNTIICLVLLLVIGGYAFVNSYYSKPVPAQTLLKVSADEIAKVDLKYPDRELTIERPKGGVWRIVKPFGVDADQTPCNNLARAIATAEVTRTVEEKPADLAPFGLSKPAVVVTVSTFKGQTLPAIEVGKTTPVGFNAYVMRGGNPAVMLTSSAFPSGMNKTVDQLRNRDLMTFKVDDVARFTIGKDDGSEIEVVRDGAKWKITKPGDYLADPTQVRQLLSSLLETKVADFIADAPGSVSQYGLEKPHLTVTVYGKGGAQESLLFGFKQSEQGKDGIYVRRGEATPVYTVHEWVMGAIDKSALDLRDRTVFNFEPSAVERAELAVGSDKFTLARAPGGKWNVVEGSNTAPADVAVVERFLDEIRDLKGASIVADPMPSPQPFGLDQPHTVVTLAGKDGKPIGTLKLSKISVKPSIPEPGEKPEPKTVYYAVSTAGKAVYSISDFSYSQLDKPAAVFRSPATAKK